MGKYKVGDKFIIEIKGIADWHDFKGMYVLSEPFPMMNETGLDQLEQYHGNGVVEIPDAVTTALRDRADTLLNEVKTLEKERDAILDYLDGGRWRTGR